MNLWPFLRSVALYATYWVKPYDMLADRRRWFWQRRTSCAVLIPCDDPACPKGCRP